MQMISLWHIRINMLFQIAAIVGLIFTYSWAELITFDKQHPDDQDSYIEAWTITTPKGDRLWYWYFKFDGTDSKDVTCPTNGFDEDSYVCDVVVRSWVTNTILNASLVAGVVLALTSTLWTYYQIHGYYHKMNVSTPQVICSDCPVFSPHSSLPDMLEPVSLSMCAELYYEPSHLRPDARWRHSRRHDRLWCGYLAHSLLGSVFLHLLPCESVL